MSIILHFQDPPELAKASGSPTNGKRWVQWDGSQKDAIAHAKGVASVREYKRVWVEVDGKEVWSS